MKKFLLASIVVSLLSFSCNEAAEELKPPTGSSWEKQSALPTENQDNMVSGGKAIAGAVFLVVFLVFMLTMRNAAPVSFDWKYQV